MKVRIDDEDDMIWRCARGADRREGRGRAAPCVAGEARRARSMPARPDLLTTRRLEGHTCVVMMKYIAPTLSCTPRSVSSALLKR